MTAAGVNGLLLASRALSHHPEARPAGRVPDPVAGAIDRGEAQATAPLKAWMGVPDPVAGAIDRGLRCVGKNFTVQPRAHAFYNLFGLARLGHNSGLRHFDGHDWYREGRDFLLKNQNADGSWAMQGQLTDSWPVVSTSFALLFLSEGRKPILIRKFAHGADEDWNFTRHDACHLTDYASATLFGGRPLAWQVYDIRDVKQLTEEQLAAEVRDLRRSPVVYLTGRQAPRLTAGQKAVLRRFVEAGGLLLAADGGGGDVNDGIRKLVAELFPKDALRPLLPRHAIYQEPTAVREDWRYFGLQCVEREGRLLVAFSSQPLAISWGEGPESAGRPGAAAFRLAGNLIAHATGGKLPPERE
jgi:hypothetical protein